MNDKTVKVLYIAGAGRSGSTLLSNILGEIPGFFNTGEIAEIFNTKLLSVSSCGCGVPVKDCKIWKEVLEKYCRNDCFTCTEDLARAANLLAHSKRLPLLVGFRRIKTLWRGIAANNIQNLSILYRTVVEVTGCETIVDASKNAGYAYILRNVTGIDMYLIHLVRDSRPAVNSWLSTKAGLWREKPWRAAITWNTRNFFAELLGRILKNKYLRIRYEDMINDPRGTINKVVDMVHEVLPDGLFRSSHEVSLGVNHSIFGNSDRFERGVVRLDAKKSRRNMKARLWWFVTFLTWPLLLHYRYSLIPSREDLHTDKPLRKTGAGIH